MGIAANEYWKFPTMLLYIGIWLVAHITSFYAIIRLRVTLPPEKFGKFILVAIDGAVMIHILFKLLAEPYTETMKMKKELKAFKGGGSKWLRCYARSCAPFKLKMTDGRFFDTLTGPIVWQFDIERLVMCLLI